MKNKIYIISLLFISILFGCKDEYEAPMYLSDASWLISESNNVRISEGIYTINQGHWISFADLSQGVLSHTWTISDSAQFMNTGFGKEEEDYSKFVIPNSGNESEDPKIHVYFGEAGIRNVRLYNTFPDSVSFTTTGETIDKVFVPGDTLASYYDSAIDAWVIDTTFVVDVYGGIKPALEVYRILEDAEGNPTGEELVAEVLEGELYTIDDTASFNTVALEMGQKLRFVDLTTFDRPDSISWSINHKTGPNTLSSANDTTISFNELGGGIVGALKVFRLENGDLKGVNAETNIPLKVTVGPSSKPFKIDGEIYETELTADNSVKFAVTGSIGAIRANAKDAFTVNVEGVGSIAVDDVVVDPSNSALIILSMADAIYNTDVITVSYSPSSDDQAIVRSDTKVMDAFANQTVIPFFMELLSDRETAGVEIEKASGNVLAPEAEGWWANINPKPASEKLFRRVESDEFADVIGVASMYFKGDVDALTACRVDYTSISDDGMVAGTYKMSIKVFMPNTNTMTSFRLQSIKGTGSFLHDFDVTSIERGKWVTLSADVVVPEITGQVKLRIDPNVGNTGVQELYFDEPSILLYEQRL